MLTFDQMRPGIDAAGGAGVPGYPEAGGIPNSCFVTRLDLQTCLANGTSAGHAIRKLEVGRRLGAPPTGGQPFLQEHPVRWPHA